MKKSIIVAVMLLVNLYVSAQTDPIRTEQNFIFQHINKSLIPTGYLNEYDSEMLHLHFISWFVKSQNEIKRLHIFRSILATIF